MLEKTKTRLRTVEDELRTSGNGAPGSSSSVGFSKSAPSNGSQGMIVDANGAVKLNRIKDGERRHEKVWGIENGSGANANGH